jgi:hypothetical protein
MGLAVLPNYAGRESNSRPEDYGDFAYFPLERRAFQDQLAALEADSSTRHAGTVDRADMNSGKLYVDLTKDQIKDSPEFDQSSYNEPTYRNRVGDYYGRYYTR